jgi:transposase-like protein
MRMLVNRQTTPWTEEEKKTLIGLVQQHGRQWAEIGRKLGRHADSCHSMYGRVSQARKRTGPFDAQENADLERVVRELTGTTAVAAADLPSSNISWIEVAKRLDDSRLSVDYARHWPRLLRDLVKAERTSVIKPFGDGGGCNESDDEDIFEFEMEPAIGGKVLNEGELLEYILQG